MTETSMTLTQVFKTVWYQDFLITPYFSIHVVCRLKKMTKKMTKKWQKKLFTVNPKTSFLYGVKAKVGKISI